MSEKEFFKSINLQQRPPSFTSATAVTTTSTLAQPVSDITYYPVDASGGAITVTLPSLDLMTLGQEIWIVNVGTANAVTIQGAAAESINGKAGLSSWKALAVQLGVVLRKVSNTQWMAVQG